MAALDIYPQLHTVLGNGQQRRRQFAYHRALRQIQPFFFTHRHIAAIVNRALREQGLQGADNGRTLIFGAGAQQLQDEEIAKAIDCHARQAVGFPGD